MILYNPMVLGIIPRIPSFAIFHFQHIVISSLAFLFRSSDLDRIRIGFSFFLNMLKIKIWCFVSNSKKFSIFEDFLILSSC